MEFVIFYENSLDFALHIEGHSRLRFCEAALVVRPTELWNRASYLRVSYIFVFHIEGHSRLKFITAALVLKPTDV